MLAVVDGIEYQRLGETEFYAQELFDKEELKGYLKNMIAAEKVVHEQVIYDSDTESAFAGQLEKNDAIKGVREATGVVPSPPHSEATIPTGRFLSRRMEMIVYTSSSKQKWPLQRRSAPQGAAGKQKG